METQLEQLTFLHFNDVYNLEEKKNEPVGGAARFKTALDSFRGRDPIVVFSGDLFEPSLLGTMYNGEQMIKPMNDFHIDAACFGNHDFDLDLDILIEYVERCNFPWVISNVKMSLDGHPLAGGKEYTIIERNGLRIGFIGLAESDWVFVIPSLEMDDFVYEDFIVCSKRLNDYLREVEKCDLVVALTHMRNPNDLKLAKEYSGLDLILGGHDHVNLIDKSNPTYVIKSGSDFVEFNKIDLTLLGSKPLDTLPEEIKPQVYREKFLVDIETIKVTKEFEPNEEIKRFIDDHLVEFQEKMKLPVLYTTVQFETRFSLVRTSEQNFPNFMTDLIRLDSGCDCAFMNCGSFRSDILFNEGVISMGDINSILPYEDLILKHRMKGKNVWQVLEHGLIHYPGTDGGFLAVSGVAFTFDPNKEPGSRILLDTLKINDKPIQMDLDYTVAANLYICRGKMAYPGFKGSQHLNEVNTADEIHTILKRFYALSKDPRILDEWKKSNLDPDELPPLELLRPPSLQRRISETKRMDFYFKLKSIIKDMIEFEGQNLMVIAPKIEGRIVVAESP